MLSDVHSRLLAVAGALMLLAACGEPPAPPLTAPPGVSPSAPGASGPVLPVPSGYSSLVPLPTGGGLIVNAGTFDFNSFSKTIGNLTMGGGAVGY